MLDQVSEADWKRFRKRVDEWRERYLAQKNQKIIAILNDEKRTPTEQFWDAKDKMQEEADILRACLDHHSRSKMPMSLAAMFQHGLIEEKDLEEFSEELRETIQKLTTIF